MRGKESRCRARTSCGTRVRSSRARRRKAPVGRRTTSSSKPRAAPTRRREAPSKPARRRKTPSGARSVRSNPIDEVVIGLDVGTTAAKAAAYDSFGRCRASSARGYGVQVLHPQQAEQEPLAIVEAARQTLLSVATRCSESKLKI